jgi:tetratricopeptide (TPR) repeat protein
VSDSCQSLRHIPFFEELGRMSDEDANWRSVSAGLVALRLLDAWIEEGPSVVTDDSWALAGVIEAIEAIDQGVPIRRVLLGVIDAMRSSSGIDLHVVTPRLMAYAQLLEYDTHWALAADIYQTIIAHGHPSEEGDLVVSASIQLGHCLRNIGDLKGASLAYTSGAELAQSNGDIIGVLRSRIGEAKVAISRGNMPEAEALLDDTIARATEHELTDVKSRALHDLASVASVRGQYDRVVKFGYQALDLSTAPRERDRILVDIATGFLELGLLDVARDAYLVLVATAQEQYVRWAAGLNLIDVASRQKMEPMFDRYRRDFESVELPPYLQASYYLIVGNGYRTFGRARDAVPYLELAVDLAARNELNQLLFEAEESLAGARIAAARPPREEAPALSSDVLEVAAAIREMRFAVASSE